MKNFNQSNFFHRTGFLLNIIVIAFFISILTSYSQSYSPIGGWSAEVNQKLETFLDSTQHLKTRKVAVFDGDGTVFGQVPNYLADEALYLYADEHFRGKSDPYSVEKMEIINRMIDNGNNVSKEYVEDRVHFLSGLTPERIEEIGYDCYQRFYNDKIYPEMIELIANLKVNDFEVWVITASPELLYQKFLSEVLGIPKVNVVGVKSVVVDGKVSNVMIQPIPQDDGKANALETFIKVEPLIVGGNSRGDMDMLNKSIGLKIVVNPGDKKVRGEDDGEMNGCTVKSYWKKEGVLIVNCNDVPIPNVDFYTTKWKIRKNIAHLKD
ncbi:haloacid dehalogenase-like hydrolase [Polaribacter filamentus]|uniref:phosphoserine phosphatase n=1 Tax=Polaribacter filamentus TaxID=53483 RepID=A0A2S7KKY4_9FLAO|nr:haloacid dehalogenase-like hydrolase [Polaribacter filamentus]PQB03285.1 haloacid dehalogenase-like hydrolase [Polaribacter filamentus]